MKKLERTHGVWKRKQTRFSTAAAIGIFLCLSMIVPGRAAEVTDLTALSIEDLLKIEITSVSKKPQKLSNATTAFCLEIRPEAFVLFLPTEVERSVYGKVTWRF